MMYYYPLLQISALLVVALLLLLESAKSFQQLSTGLSFASRRGEDAFRSSHKKPTAVRASTDTRESDSFLSSGLISQLAVVALKARLRAQTSVVCDVRAQNNGFLQGSIVVGPATVKGRSWQGLGLTCRAIEATVDICELDKRRILAEKRLVLTQPCKSRLLSQRLLSAISDGLQVTSFRRLLGIADFTIVFLQSPWKGHGCS